MIDEREPVDIVFRGRIVERCYGENYAALFLDEDGKSEEPLALRALEALGSGRLIWDEEVSRFIRLRYLISDEAFPAEAFDERAATVQIGLAHVVYRDRYSDVTGYLWTDESINVGEDEWHAGGHEIMTELRSHLGRWCHLVITVTEDGQ